MPLYRYIGGVSAKDIPVPMVNIVNGGMHADNNVDIQEFMIMPVGARSFREGIRMCAEVFHNLRSVLKAKGYNTSVGDEGGFAPNLKTNEEALKNIEESVAKAWYKWGEQIFVALDPATSELWNEAAKEGKQGHKFFKSTQETVPSDQLIDLWADWCNRYPIRSLEDGLAENDWEPRRSRTWP